MKYTIELFERLENNSSKRADGIAHRGRARDSGVTCCHICKQYGTASLGKSDRTGTVTRAASTPASTAMPPGLTGVKSRVEPISALLRKAPNRYAIPLYQREFSWPKTQIEALLEDLNVVQEKRSAGDPYRRFFGTIYIQHDSNQQVNWVLDGQQRLTTFQLILLATEDIVGHPGSDNLFDGLDSSRLKAVKDMLREALIHYHSGLLLLEAEFESEAQKHILSAALGSRNTEAKSFGDTNRAAKVYCEGFSTAFQWLHERIELHSSRLDFIEHFVHGLFESEVIVADLDTSADVFQIFDGLNSRGKPLETHERVKNILFSSVFPDPVRQGDFKTRWGQLCNDFRGGLELDFNTVLQYCAILREAKEVEESKVVPACEKAILSGSSGPDDFLSHLENLVTRLKEIGGHKAVSPGKGVPKKQLKAALGRITLLKARFSLLPLFAVEGDKWQSKSTIDLCTWVEHFTFRCMTVKSVSNLENFKSVIIASSIQLRDAVAAGTLPAAVEAFRVAALDECPDSALIGDFRLRSENSSSIQRYVLEKLASAWDPSVAYPDSAQVEHIYPKTPIGKKGGGERDFWRHMRGKPGYHYPSETDSQKRARLKSAHKFGNLILLHDGANIRLSNHGPHVKFTVNGTGDLKGYIHQTPTAMMTQLIALARRTDAIRKMRVDPATGETVEVSTPRKEVRYHWDGELIERRQEAMALDAPDVWYLSKINPVGKGQKAEQWRKQAKGLAFDSSDLVPLAESS